MTAAIFPSMTSGRVPLFTKGTDVTIKTTNGGVVTAPLVENHYATFDAVIRIGTMPWRVPCWRIASIEAAANGEPTQQESPP